MVYVFTTQAGGRITYTDLVGATLLQIVGKRPGPRGVITPAEIPGAIAAIEAAIARGFEMPEEERRELAPHADDDRRRRTKDRDEDEEEEPPISLASRAQPFVELLRLAQRENENVTWGI